MHRGTDSGQTKRLEKPTIAVVSFGKARPEFGCVGCVYISESDGRFSQDPCRRVIDHVLDPLSQVERFPAIKLSSGTKGDHTD